MLVVHIANAAATMAWQKDVLFICRQACSVTVCWLVLAQVCRCQNVTALVIVHCSVPEKGL